MALVPILLGAQLMLVSDRPPSLDTGPSCAAAAVSGVDSRSNQSCMNDETTAKNSVTANWRHYSPAQQARCTGLVTTGGPPSYVELLTCLEMAAQAKTIPGGDALKPAAAGVKPGAP
jgi:hypothetical protein